MSTRVVACCFLVLLMPALSRAQTGSSAAERLSLEKAIRLALDQNREVQSAALQVAKAEEDLAAARTRRLPVFETEVMTSELLTPVSFAFPRGAFGEFPGTGPIPAVDTAVTVPRQPTVFVTSQVSQPLSQLFKINLGITNAGITREIARERLRAQQLALVNDVKRLYFGILQTESALTATEDAIALFRELDRTLELRVAQKVALRADALDVQLRLAQEELTRTSAANTLASQKEQLNQLLGRDVRTSFEVEDVAAMSALEIDLDAARTYAVANRPEVREAHLVVRQAEIDKRVTKADRIPDVSVAVSYTSNINMNVMPQNLATVGVQVKWEPFDWGRKGREVAAKAHIVQQAQLHVRDAEDRVVLEINSRFRTLTEARARLLVAQVAQSASREKLRVKTNQFQLQAALLADVLQQRADVADTTDRYQQALLAFWTAKADFDRATGEEVIK